MEIVPLWDDQNIAHVACHAVTVEEVEEVLDDDNSLVEEDNRYRKGRLIVWGRTSADRYLLVAFDRPNSNGGAYVVTARPMTPKERRAYEEAL